MSATKTPRRNIHSDEENMDCNNDNDGGSAVRRSNRKRTPSKKLQIHNEMLSKQYANRQNTPNKPKSAESESDDDVDDSSFEIDVQPSQAAILFNENKELAGGEIYAHRTPKKRNGMMNLAVNTPKTPLTEMKSMALNSPRTPKNHHRLADAKTPHETRSKMRKAIQKKTQIEEDSDFSADEDSDYKCDESDSSEDDSQNDTSQDEEVTPPKQLKATARNNKSTKSIAVPTSSRPGLRQRKKPQNTEFVPNSEDYFVTVSSKKNKTSDNTLDQLKSSRLQYKDLFSILKSIRLSDEHEKRIIEMNDELETYFDRWMLEMSQGYNIITYGLGSKQRLLHKFCERHMGDRPLIVVNGFFPTITVKEILQSIKVDMLEQNATTRNEHEIVDLIASTLMKSKDYHLFLVINNIDGPMLRKIKDQHVLSRLAKIKNVHLIASIDHINAPLMWDQTCADNYNFIWYDCTTMLPYENETAFEDSVFLQSSGDMNLAAMNNVFQSLTTNARGIYMILVAAQIENQKDSTYPGMPFKELYRKCREKFLVSSDSALRTQLIEFVDHNMVKLKRSNDGTEHVSIPINPDILLVFTQQQKE